jgi:tetratricopeptide (TPR) repeat protein
MDFNGNQQPTGFDALIPDRTEMECEDLFAQADRLLNDGQTIEAVDKLSMILKRNPRFGKAYNHLGWVYETKYRNYTKAEEYYRAALQFAPHYTAPYLNYAYLLSNLGRYDELKTHLDRASQVAGIAKDTLNNEYANMYEMQGNLQLAIDYYQKAAIVTLDSTRLDTYKAGIERCKKKMDILNPTSGF